MRLFVRLFARSRRLEQRQRDIIGQPPHRPKRGTAVEPDGTKRIGVREQNQSALGQCGVAGEILKRRKGTALSRGDDALGPIVYFLHIVIPEWCVSTRPGISRFSGVQLHIRVRALHVAE